MDPTTALISVCLIGIGACVAWYARGWVEEQMTVAEFEADDEDE